jgi:hypothetical protein
MNEQVMKRRENRAREKKMNTCDFSIPIFLMIFFIVIEY